MLEPIFSTIKEPAPKASPQKQTPTEKPNPSGEAKAPNVNRVQRKKVSSRFSSPSVTDALNGKLPGEKQLSAKEQHALYTNTEEAEPFTQEQLNKKWKEFLDQKSDRPILTATLSEIPKLSNDYKLKVSIENSVQEDVVRNFKPELISYLRKELRNSKIDLITKIETKKRKRIVYTDSEKFQEMLKKNPELDELKNRFKLDFGE